MHSRRLAPAHCHLSPPESDDERASPKRTRNATKIPKKTKKQLKSPTKNVKDVNDNTKVKDCVTSTISSPKTVKNKTQKKSCKEKKDEKPDTQKRERKDSKSSNTNKKDEGSKAKQAKLQAPTCTDALSRVKGISWTREEDKSMLQVLKVEADSELVFGRVQELLPHRSVTEIKERICHVMTLLQQMAGGEVT